MDGSSDDGSMSPPSPAKMSVIGSAIASIKSYFTPERVVRPHTDGFAPSIGITPLTKEFAGMSINDSSHNSTDSFRTSKSVVDDDSFLSTNSFAEASDHDSSSLHIDPETPYDPDATVLNEGTVIEGSNLTQSRIDDLSHGEIAHTDSQNASSVVSDEIAQPKDSETQKNATGSSETPKNSVLSIITPLLEVTMNHAPVALPSNILENPVRAVQESTSLVKEPSVEPSCPDVSTTEAGMTKSVQINTPKVDTPSVPPQEQNISSKLVEEPAATQPEVPEEVQGSSKDPEARTEQVPDRSLPTNVTSPEEIWLSPDQTILLSSSPESDPLRKYERFADLSESIICLDSSDEEGNLKEPLLGDLSGKEYKEYLEDSEIILKLPQDVTMNAEKRADPLPVISELVAEKEAIQVQDATMNVTKNDPQSSVSSEQMPQKENSQAQDVTMNVEKTSDESSLTSDSSEGIPEKENSQTTTAVENVAHSSVTSELVPGNELAEVKKVPANAEKIADPYGYLAELGSEEPETVEPCEPPCVVCTDGESAKIAAVQAASQRYSEKTDEARAELLRSEVRRFFEEQNRQLKLKDPEPEAGISNILEDLSVGKTCVCDTNEVMLEPVHGSPAENDEVAEDLQISLVVHCSPAAKEVQANGDGEEEDLQGVAEEMAEAVLDSSGEKNSPEADSPQQKEVQIPTNDNTPEQITVPTAQGSEATEEKNVPAPSEIQNSAEKKGVKNLLEEQNTSEQSGVVEVARDSAEKVVQDSTEAQNVSAEKEVRSPPKQLKEDSVGAPSTSEVSAGLSTQAMPGEVLSPSELMEISYAESPATVLRSAPCFVPPARPITFTEEPMEVSFNTSTNEHHEPGLFVQTVDVVPTKQAPKTSEPDKSDEETISADSSTDSFDSQLTAKTLEEAAGSKESSEDEPVSAGVVEVQSEPVAAISENQLAEESKLNESHVPEMSVAAIPVTAAAQPTELDESTASVSNKAEKPADKPTVAPEEIKVDISLESKKLSESQKKGEKIPESSSPEPAIEIAPPVEKSTSAPEEIKLDLPSDESTPPKMGRASLQIPTVSIIPATPERERSKDEIVFVPRDIPEVPLADTTVDFGVDRTTIVFSPSAAESTRIQEECFSPNQTTFCGAGDTFGEEACVTDAAALIKGRRDPESSPEMSICANFTEIMPESFVGEENATLGDVEPLENPTSVKPSSMGAKDQVREVATNVVDEIVVMASEKVAALMGSEETIHARVEGKYEQTETPRATQSAPSEVSRSLEEAKELAKMTVEAIVEGIEKALNRSDIAEKSQSEEAKPAETNLESPVLSTSLHGFSLLEKESPVSTGTPDQDGRSGLLIDASPLVLQTIQQKKNTRDLLSETVDFNQSTIADSTKRSETHLIDASPFVLQQVDRQTRDLLSETLDDMNRLSVSEVAKTPDGIDLAADSAVNLLAEPSAISGRLLSFENSIENEEEPDFCDLEESAIIEEEEDDEKLMLSTIQEVTEISLALSPAVEVAKKEEKIMSTTPVGMFPKDKSPMWDSPVDVLVKHNVESTPLHAAITRVLNESNVSVSPISNGHESQTESLLNEAMVEVPSTSECAGNSNASEAKSCVSFNVSPMLPMTEEPILEDRENESQKEDAEIVFKVPKSVGKVVKMLPDSAKSEKDCTIFVGAVVAEALPKEDAKVVVVAPYRTPSPSENDCDENAVLPNKPAGRKSSGGILREINENVILEETMGAVLGGVKENVSELKQEVINPEALARESMLKEIERLKELYRQKAEEEERREKEFKKKMHDVERLILEKEMKLVESEERNKKYENIYQTQQGTFQQSQIVCNELKNSAKKAKSFVEGMRPVPPEKLESAKASCETAKQHVASAESAFIDVHAKFEALKSKIPVIKKSIADGEKEVIDLRRQKAVVDEKVRAAEAQTNAELEEISQAISEEKERFVGESTRIGAQLRKAELVAKTTQDSLDKITLDNERLSNLCDDIIAGKT